MARDTNIPSPFDATHWRSRAEEARIIAEQMRDAASRSSMLRIANEYDEMARRASVRAAQKKRE